MWKQLLLTIYTNIGAFFFGAAAAWSSPSMSVIVENERYYFWVTKNQFGFIVAAMPLGAMLSCVASGIIRHKFGTRRTVLIFAMPATCGAILIAIPKNIVMLILGRFLVGVTIGCFLYIGQIFIGEFSSVHYRGTLLSFIHIFVHSGAIFVYSLGYFVSHQTLNIVYGSIPIIYALGFQFLNESPPFLMEKEKIEEAKKSLNKLRKCKNDYESERRSLQNKSAGKKSFCEILQVKSTKRATIVMSIQFFFFQMSGFNAIKFYAQNIFIEAGVSQIHPGVAAIIYASVLTISAIFTAFVANYFGRRKMLCTFNFFCALSLATIGGYFHAKEMKLDVTSFGWIPLFAVCIYSITFSLGTASVTWTLLGELFMIEAKQIMAPLAQVINHGLTFVIVLAFPILAETIGCENVFYIFAIATLIDVIFAFFFIPETRGKSIDEIQKALEV